MNRTRGGGPRRRIERSPTRASDPGPIPGSGGILGPARVKQLLTLVQVSDSQAAVDPRRERHRQGTAGTGRTSTARERSRSSKILRGPVRGLLGRVGHIKGAYTGAHRDKVSRFEMANSGTVFRRDWGRVAGGRRSCACSGDDVRRVGSSEPTRMDVAIAATHQNLEQLIREGRFREICTTG
jgi:hypothetical protein